MAKLPVARQASIPGLLIFYLVMVVVGVCAILLSPPNYKLHAFVVVILFFVIYPNYMPRLCYPSLKRGIRLLRKGEYEKAVPNLEKGLEETQRRAFWDTYRYILLLNPTKISYREMALIDIAFCYEQLGDGAMAQQYYQKAHEMFPKSFLAKAGLNKVAAYKRPDAENN